MYIYGMVFFLLIASSFIEIFKKNYKLKPILILYVFVALSLLAGLRYEVGFDYYGYVQIFQQTPSFGQLLFGQSNNLQIHGEYGYLIFNSIIKTLGLNVDAVLMIISTVTMFLIIFAYKNYSKYYFIAVYYYVARFYFLLNMGQIRQALAMGILLVSIKYIAEKKLIKFILLVFLAASFHQVSYVFLPLYFISKLNIKPKQFTILLLFSLILGTTGWLDLFFRYFINYIPDSITNYYNAEKYGYKLGIFDPVAVFRITVVYLIFIYQEKLRESVKYFDIFFRIYMCGVITLIMLNDIALLATRTAVVFAIFEGIFIASFVGIFKNKLLGHLLIIGLVTILLYINFYLKLHSDFIPYKSILSY